MFAIACARQEHRDGHEAVELTRRPGRTLRQIRVHAEPSWDADQVRLSWWFVKDGDPPGIPADWPALLDRPLVLFHHDEARRFRLDPPIARRLEDMTARDYVESDRLDLVRLSVA